MGEILNILNTLNEQQSRQELAQIVQTQSDQIARQQSWLYALSVACGLLVLLVICAILEGKDGQKKAKNLEKRLDTVLTIRQDQHAA